MAFLNSSSILVTFDNISDKDDKFLKIRIDGISLHAWHSRFFLDTPNVNEQSYNASSVEFSVGFKKVVIVNPILNSAPLNSKIPIVRRSSRNSNSKYKSKKFSGNNLTVDNLNHKKFTPIGENVMSIRLKTSLILIVLISKVVDSINALIVKPRKLHDSLS
ncbi:hypothetical protein ACFE04_011334 [Oxalis oulophora]